MTLYRHFDSKDLLVAECLRRLAAETDAAWEENARAHAGDPRGQLLGWVRGLGAWKLDLAERGCAFLNTAAELPDKDHPARRVVEEFKGRFRERFIALCREAELSEPELLAGRDLPPLRRRARQHAERRPRGPSQTASRNAAAPDRQSYQAASLRADTTGVSGRDGGCRLARKSPLSAPLARCRTSR